MLYLLRTFGRGSRTSLKVGFTDDIVNRRSSYYHSNPFYELLSIREGDEYAEKVLHLYLTARGFKNHFKIIFFSVCNIIFRRGSG